MFAKTIIYPSMMFYKPLPYSQYKPSNILYIEMAGGGIWLGHKHFVWVFGNGLDKKPYPAFQWVSGSVVRPWAMWSNESICYYRWRYSKRI